jgi:hypothetical protein
MTQAIRFIPYLDDIKLDLEYVDDVVQKSFSKDEFPGVDGASYTDLGMHARQFNGRAWFKGVSFDNFQKFQDAVAIPDAVHNFVHPVHGLIVGVVLSHNARHDARKGTAVVDFQFEEQLQGNFEDRLTPLVQPQIEEMVTAGQAATVSSFSDKILRRLGPSALAVINRTVDMTQNLGAQFIDMAQNVKMFVAEIDAALAEFEGFCAEITQPANTLIANIEYGSTLPGLFIAAIAHSADRYMALVDTATQAPYMVLQSFFNGMLQLSHAVPDFSHEISIVKSHAGSLLAAKLFKKDDDARAAAAIVDAASAWNGRGEYIGRAKRPEVLTVTDLERILDLVRINLQIPLSIDHSLTANSDIASAFLRHVNTIKINRERIVKKDVLNELPLQFVCHSNGLGYTAAERVLTVNQQIQNPSFVSGEVSIYD